MASVAPRFTRLCTIISHGDYNEDKGMYPKQALYVCDQFNVLQATSDSYLNH